MSPCVLPCELSPVKTYHVRPRPGSSASARPARILLVDDDPCLSRLMALFLIHAGYAVDTAADGEQGWVALKLRHYDLLMTDNDMPRLTGLELIRRLRGMGMTLPVIVVSGSEEIRGLAKDRVLDLTAVVPKPFQPDDLLAQVERVTAD